MTNQLINETKSIRRSETQRGVIRAIPKRIWIKRTEMELEMRIWTFCEFPDLPVVLCEGNTPKCVAFDANVQKKTLKPNFN